jgi:ribosomal-protein-alanine N-acetyltransferase
VDTTYPLLRTERLLLRRWHEADREPFAAMNADPAVMAQFPAPLSRQESDAFLDRIEAHFDEHGYGLWAVEAEGALLGFTGLQWTEGLPCSPALEVGWRLVRDAWGHGYATEAATAALGVGLARAGSVVSVTAVTNERSWRVMERLGMRREGIFDHPRVPEGHPLRPHYLYRTP